MYYKITITNTSKPMGGRDREWSTWNTEEKKYKTLEEVKQYITDNYPKCKKVKMYRDGKDNGEAVHVGYIYSYKNYDWEGGKRFNYYQADWVEVSEVVEKSVIVS